MTQGRHLCGPPAKVVLVDIIGDVVYFESTYYRCSWGA